MHPFLVHSASLNYSNDMRLAFNLGTEWRQVPAKKKDDSGAVTGAAAAAAAAAAALFLSLSLPPPPPPPTHTHTHGVCARMCACACVTDTCPRWTPAGTGPGQSQEERESLLVSNDDSEKTLNMELLLSQYRREPNRLAPMPRALARAALGED